MRAVDPGQSSPPLVRRGHGSLVFYVFRFISNGQVVWRANYECREDLDALDEAEQLAEGCEVQVWQDGRMVARVKKGNAPWTPHDAEQL